MKSTKLSQDEQLHSQVELHPSEKHTGDSTRGICFRRYITLSEAWARDNGEEGARQSPSNDADPPSSGVGFCIVPGVQQPVLSCQPADLRTVGMTVITKLEKVILLELTFLDLNSDKRGQRAAVLCYLFV